MMMEEVKDVDMDENGIAFEPVRGTLESPAMASECHALTVAMGAQKSGSAAPSPYPETSQDADSVSEAKRARFDEVVLAEESMPTSVASDWTQESLSEAPQSVPPEPAGSDGSPNKETPSGNTPVASSRPMSRTSSTASQLSRIGSRVPTSQSLCLTDLFEYQWPAEDFSMSERSGPSRVSTPILATGPDKPEPDWYMVQELLSECLRIKSFKRKYPDLSRRTIDAWERQYLTQKGYITGLGTTQADLGLTALRSEEVMALIEKDHPEYHSAVSQILQQRRIQSISDKQKAQYQTCRVERGSRLEQHRKRALKSVTQFNRSLLHERRAERLYYWDMATFQIHVQQRSQPRAPEGLPPACPSDPAEGSDVLPLETPQAVRQLTSQRPALNPLRDEFHADGCFPLAIIPGQFSHYYKRYTAEELGYMPVGKSIFQKASKRDLENLDAVILSPRRPPTVEPTVTPDPRITASTAASANTSAAANASSLTEAAMDENSQSSLALVDEEATNDTAVSIPTPIDCTICGNEAQDPVRCSDCPKAGHARCMELPEHMREAVRTYSWSCMDCKKCVECLDPGHEDLMMFCDRCDRGYHAFCVGLEGIPEGNWECPSCTPDGPEDDLPLSKVKKTVRHKRSKRAIQMAAAAAAAIAGDLQG